MGYRTRQINVTHALTAHLGERHFHSTLLTNYTTVFETLVFTTEALIILDRTKDLGTKEAITLWFKGTVVNGLWLLDLTK